MNLLVVLLHPRCVVGDELPVPLVLLPADVRVHPGGELEPHQLAAGHVASRGARPAEKKHQNYYFILDCC